MIEFNEFVGSHGLVSLNFINFTSFHLVPRSLVKNNFINFHFTSTVEEVVDYESIKRELKIKPIYECRCDERLQTKTKKFTHLSYTGLVVELEHLKIKTRLTNEKFASVKGECEI